MRRAPVPVRRPPPSAAQQIAQQAVTQAFSAVPVVGPVIARAPAVQALADIDNLFAASSPILPMFVAQLHIPPPDVAPVTAPAAVGVPDVVPITRARAVGGFLGPGGPGGGVFVD